MSDVFEVGRVHKLIGRPWLVRMEVNFFETRHSRVVLLLRLQVGECFIVKQSLVFDLVFGFINFREEIDYFIKVIATVIAIILVLVEIFLAR